MSINLHLISACSIVAPIIIGAIYFKSLSFAIRILFLFVAITGVFELITTVMSLNQMNNLLFFHTYVYIEFLAVVAIFFFSYDSVFWRGMALFFLGSFLLFSLVNNVFFEAVDLFNSNQRYAEGIIVLLMCAGYYISLLRRPIHRYLERQPMFWLASGWLIYFAGTLYLFLFSQELLAMNAHQWWAIHAILNIGLNMIYVISFLKARKL